jgi:hypothetical protein
MLLDYYWLAAPDDLACTTAVAVCGNHAAIMVVHDRPTVAEPAVMTPKQQV